MRRAGALSRSWAFKISPVSFICLSLLSYTFVSSHDEHYEPIFHDHIGTSSQTLLQTPPAVFCQCWSTAAQPPFSRPAIQQQEVNSSNYYSHRHSRLRQRGKRPTFLSLGCQQCWHKQQKQTACAQWWLTTVFVSTVFRQHQQVCTAYKINLSLVLEVIRNH